jgi:hypothetical protein
MIRVPQMAMRIEDAVGNKRGQFALPKRTILVTNEFDMFVFVHEFSSPDGLAFRVFPAWVNGLSCLDA